MYTSIYTSSIYNFINNIHFMQLENIMFQNFIKIIGLIKLYINIKYNYNYIIVKHIYEY